MVSLSLTERYFAAHCAMLFATSVAAILITFAMVWLARRRKDPARWCLTFIKFAAFFFILYCFVEFCADAVWIAFSRLMRSTQEQYDNFDKEDDYALLATLLQARIELTAASRFTDCVIVIFIFLSIVSLGVGVNVVRRGEPAGFDGLIRRVSYVFASILGILALVEWVIRIKVYLEFYTDKYDIDQQEKPTLMLLNASRQIDFAFVVIAWALSIAVMVRSTQVWLPSRFEKKLDFPLMYLMLCSGAWLLRETYELVMQLKFVNIQDIRRNPDQPPYLEIIDMVFHTWSVFAVVCLIFALGVKKDNGLWSTEQPFMMYNPDGSQNVPLEPRDPSPPAYSSSPSSSSPSADYPTPQVTNTNSPSTQPPSGQPAQVQQGWSQPQGASQEQLGHEDRGLVENLAAPPQCYQPPVADNAYNTGIVSPVSPSEAGPSDGYGIGMSIPSQSPPPHDEAMGLYHQADGRPPGAEPLPYPEKN